MVIDILLSLSLTLAYFWNKWLSWLHQNSECFKLDWKIQDNQSRSLHKCLLYTQSSPVITSFNATNFMTE